MATVLNGHIHDSVLSCKCDSMFDGRQCKIRLLFHSNMNLFGCFIDILGPERQGFEFCLIVFIFKVCLTFNVTREKTEVMVAEAGGVNIPRI